MTSFRLPPHQEEILKAIVNGIRAPAPSPFLSLPSFLVRRLVQGIGPQLFHRQRISDLASSSSVIGIVRLQKPEK